MNGDAADDIVDDVVNVAAGIVNLHKLSLHKGLPI